MWIIASAGIAVEVLVFILPWAIGWVEFIDPQLSRTFFWFTGHPLVYFWLLPAYVAWYTLLPKLAGGKLFSDPLARLVFILFIVLSTPVGFHHQYTDPGVPTGWKTLHAIFTFSLFIPSMLTAFTVIASLENAGRKRGGKGILGWIWKLPWGNPSVSAMLLAGIAFMFGGIGGLINASYNINLVVHNTSFIPGHFHLTVGGAVTITFMGLAYWLLPQLLGRKLWSPKVAVAQTWTYFIGLMIFSRYALGRYAGLPPPRADGFCHLLAGSLEHPLLPDSVRRRHYVDRGDDVLPGLRRQLLHQACGNAGGRKALCRSDFTGQQRAGHL